MGWEVEYSKSGRAKCKGCSEKIEKDVVRCGKEEFHPTYGPCVGWYHPECVKWSRGGLDPQSMLGFSYLRPEDKASLRSIASGTAAARSGGPGSSRWAPLPRPGQPWVPPPISASASSEAGSLSQSSQPQAMEEPNWATLASDREESDVLYGRVGVTVVGCRYYGGTLHEGEFGEMVREPHNHYDRNAIRVDNMQSIQVGHIKRDQAAALAPMLDDPSPLKPWIDVDVNEGGVNMFQVSCTASIYGPREYAEQVLRYIVANGLRLKGQSSGTGASGAAPSLVRSVRVSAAESSQKSLDQLYDELKSDLSQLDTAAVMSALTGKLVSPLYEHQKQGVAWMLSREANSSLPPLWQEVNEGGRTLFYNQVTKSSQSAAPAPVKGGLVCDDMGLGKTLQTLCCVAADQIRATAAQGGRRSTLIVCPSSVLSNWVSQAEAHFVEGFFKVLVYHGSERLTHDLSAYDIVVTTYGTLAQESDTKPCSPIKKPQKKRKKAGAEPPETFPGLTQTPFLRVVLDEAHTIRNNKTHAYRAALQLDCSYRWCLTGTPLQNKPEDIQSLLAFERAAPLEDPKIFGRAIARPIREGDPNGIAKLRLMLGVVCIRRTKALIQSSLPEKVVEVHRLKLEGPQKVAYDAIYASTRVIVQGLLSGGDADVMRNYASVLECLLRLRQVCDAVALVPQERLDRAIEVAREVEAMAKKVAKGKRGKKAPMTAEEASKLLKKLQGALEEAAGKEGSVAEGAGAGGEGAFECAVCLGDLEASKARILRNCSHTFCDYCLERLLRNSGHSERCPLCRTAFRASDVLQARDLEARLSQEEEAKNEVEEVSEEAVPKQEPLPRDERPLKVMALLEGLRAAWREDVNQKAVVFSQFTKMLDITQRVLREEGVESVQLEGKMSLQQRARAIGEFSRVEGGPAVMLVSLKAGGQGINLERANLVYMLDLWWNAAVEDQAMDRVWRIGQTRKVRVVRYLSEDTIEERLLQVQEEKRELGRGALSAVSAEEVRRSRVADLRTLFA